jgi:hypothetical protein
MYSVSMGRTLLEVASATLMVLLLTWIATLATGTIVDVLQKMPPRYSVRSLLILMAATAIVVTIGAALLRD